MQKIKLDMTRFQKPAVKSKITSERQLLIKEFLERLNAERGSQFKPLTPARVGRLLRYLDTQGLYQFLATCKDAKSFSKFFWWSVNPKKHA